MLAPERSCGVSRSDPRPCSGTFSQSLRALQTRADIGDEIKRRLLIGRRPTIAGGLHLLLDSTHYAAIR
jgi:hypothetical protein